MAPHPGSPSALPLAPAPDHWLTPARLAAYPRIVLAVCLASAAAWLASSTDLLDPRGQAIGYDFITFWAASLLALGGEPAAAYDLQRLFAAEAHAVPGLGGGYSFHYPPTFLLVILPLALLPYLVAYAAFVAATGAAFAAVMRRIVDDRRALLLIAAFPGVYVNAMHGQNGYITTALLGGALLALDRRPVLGGALIGLMAYKPHFAMLMPVALLVSRSWRAIAAAAVVAVAFTALSTAVLGTDALAAFLRVSPWVREQVESGNLPWHKMPTVFAAARLLGAGVLASYAVQAIAAAIAVAGLVAVWRRQAPLALRGAMLIVATMLATPYMFDYDMVMLALPIAWLAVDGLARGWLPYEREVLVAAWLAPLPAPNVALLAHVQIGPLVAAALFAIILRRAGVLGSAAIARA